MTEHILQMNLEMYIEQTIVPSNDAHFDIYDYIY